LAYFERLTNENPQTLQNPQRMMRFVEVCIGTGTLFLVLNQKQNERGFTPIIIGLEAERSVMYTRINQRVDIMMQHGLLTEAKGLHANKELNALQTVGYRELFNGEAYNLLSKRSKNTRRFAKRQITWFKEIKPKWYDDLKRHIKQL
jgi:tRNA dimethylallyltransferase